jgi:hypothetical protein
VFIVILKNKSIALFYFLGDFIITKKIIYNILYLKMKIAIIYLLSKIKRIYCSLKVFHMVIGLYMLSGRKKVFVVNTGLNLYFIHYDCVFLNQ